jgi:NagD protein
MGRREIRSWLMDMDGVLVHEESAIPGAAEFLGRLRALERAPMPSATPTGPRG